MHEPEQTLEQQLRQIVPEAMRAPVLERMRAKESAYADAQSTQTPKDTLRWPADVAPKDVADWLEKHAPDQTAAKDIKTEMFGVSNQSPSNATLTQQCALAAYAFQAWRSLQKDLQRPALAVDAGRTHHDLVCGLRALPKNKKTHQAEVIKGRAEILAPDGRSVQLLMPLDGPEGLHSATIETLQQWRGWEGVRHWAALQRLFSVEGGRSGAVRWTLETHLDALGYADYTRRDPSVRDRVAREVELLTRLELAVYNSDGSLRAKQPLIAVGTKYEALRDAEWALEGMELRVNEWLYQGIRNAKTGKLGTAWYPAPIELGQIDHVRFPYAIVLGLILPIRWRWDLGKRDHCALSGEHLLATAGIRLSKENPGRTWNALRENLDELQRCGGLGRYEWDGTPWSHAGVCRLYPPQWARDRTVHGLRPCEPLPSPAVLTGGEFKAWRKTQGWTQVKAAKELGVSERAIRLAEANTEKPLSRSILDGMRKRAGKNPANPEGGQIPADLSGEGDKNRGTPRKATGKKQGDPAGKPARNRGTPPENRQETGGPRRNRSAKHLKT